MDNYDEYCVETDIAFCGRDIREWSAGYLTWDEREEFARTLADIRRLPED